MYKKKAFKTLFIVPLHYFSPERINVKRKVLSLYIYAIKCCHGSTHVIFLLLVLYKVFIVCTLLCKFGSRSQNLGQVLQRKRNCSCLSLVVQYPVVWSDPLFVCWLLIHYLCIHFSSCLKFWQLIFLHSKEYCSKYHIYTYIFGRIYYCRVYNFHLKCMRI